MSATQYPIFTVGHSNHSPDVFAQLLVRHGVDEVVDVRSAPYSRYTPQFNHEPLQRALEDLGITYAYLGGELGGRPADRSCYDADGRVSYDRVADTDQFDVDEYDVIGGMMQQPVPLVKCESVPLEVPAHAEMILEGRILPNVREEEGPFGEFTGHAVGVRRNHVAEITGITLRQNPLYQDIFTGHSEQRLMGSIPREAAIFRAVKAVAGGTRAVHMPPSGNCRFHCYISLDKRSDGEVRNAVMAAMATDLYLKLVIVVDGDVNVYNEGDVMWAVANRVQADADTLIIPRCQGSETDPSSGQGGLTAKMVIDATKKRKDFPRRLAVPDEVRERVRLEDYIG